MKKASIAAAALFLAVLFLVPAWFFWQKDAEFSESENRYLAQKPTVSSENVFRGKFMEDTEEYIDDQFPGRSVWLNLQSDVRRLCGSREIGGVYLAKDGYLMEKWLPQALDEQQLADNTAAVNRLAAAHPAMSVSLMLVPTAGMVLTDKLPVGAPMVSAQAAYEAVLADLQGVSYVDVTERLAAHRDEYVYYKTDHHWTTYGAYLAYTAFCDVRGVATALDAFEVEQVTDRFQGTLHAKVLGHFCARDSIDIYRRAGETPCEVAYNFGRSRSNTVYDTEKLVQKDKYQVFLGGNHPEVTITTGVSNGNHLLVVKDSFANAFVPFLLGDYETVHVIDPRYYHGDVEEYIRDNAINECLVLYNIKNFCEDKNLSEMVA